MRNAALIAVLAPVLLAGCAASTTTTTTITGSASPEASASTPATADRSDARVVTTRSGLQYEDLRVGDGALAENGMETLVHYTGWFTDGQKFESSYDRGQPYRLVIGNGEVMRGWEEGLLGMRVGGRRKLIVPPHLGYGAAGRGKIPPNATLVFELEMTDLR